MNLHIPNDALRVECYCNLLLIGAGIAVIAWSVSVAVDTIRDLRKNWRAR